MAENRFFECDNCRSSEDPMEIEDVGSGLFSVTCASCGHAHLMDESQAVRIRNEKRAEEGWKH